MRVESCGSSGPKVVVVPEPYECCTFAQIDSWVEKDHPKNCDTLYILSDGSGAYYWNSKEWVKVSFGGSSGDFVTNPEFEAHKTQQEKKNNSKADDSNVVHLTGDEKINGSKTFEGPVNVNGKASFSGEVSLNDKVNLPVFTYFGKDSAFRSISTLLNGFTIPTNGYCGYSIRDEWVTVEMKITCPDLKAGTGLEILDVPTGIIGTQEREAQNVAFIGTSLSSVIFYPSTKKITVVPSADVVVGSTLTVKISFNMNR